MNLRLRTHRHARVASCVIPMLSLMLCAGSNAQFTYITNDNTIAITAYTGPGTDVEIPDTLDGLPVKDIGEFAFMSASNITTLTIGINLTNIGAGAFSSCTNLVQAAIPGNVVSIGIGAFLGCSSLSDLTLGAGIKRIDDYAFSFCPSLVSVTIPEGVEIMGWGVFQNCDNLTDVRLPDSVTGIGDLTFDSCTNLTRIVIPSGVTNIGYSAFGYNPTLAGLFFRGDAPEPESTTFWGSTNATAYYLPGTTGWQTNYAGLPTAVWLPLIRQEIGVLGASDDFGFVIDWAKGMNPAVEVCNGTDVDVWNGIATNQLLADQSRFEDPESSNSASRLYRLRWP